MKGLVYYGPKDIKLSEVEKPKINDGEVLIKVKAVGICGSDSHGYLGNTGRRIPPMIMGHEFSGVISDVSSNVTDFKKEDRVVVHPVLFCGKCECCKKGLTNVCMNRGFLGVMDINGAMAEYVKVPQSLVYKIPDSMSSLEGAMVEPLAVAYRAVEKLSDIKGKHILIVGAGTIGLLILQLVKLKSPKKIFVSDLSDTRLKLAHKIGADITINPIKESIDKIVKSETDGVGVDVALEAVGAAKSVEQAMMVLKNTGTCIWVGNAAKKIEIDMQNVVTRELNVFGTYIYTKEDFEKAIELIINKTVDTTSVISKVVTLENGPEMFEQLLNDPDNLIKIIITI